MRNRLHLPPSLGCAYIMSYAAAKYTIMIGSPKNQTHLN